MARSAMAAALAGGLLMMALAVAAELPRQTLPGEPVAAAAGDVVTQDSAYAGIGGTSAHGTARADAVADGQPLNAVEEVRGLAIKEGLEQRIRRHLQSQVESSWTDFSLLSVSGIAYSADRVRMHGYGLYGQNDAAGFTTAMEVQFIASFDKRSGRLESLTHQPAPPRAGDLIAELQSRESHSGDSALARFTADAF